MLHSKLTFTLALVVLAGCTAPQTRPPEPTTASAQAPAVAATASAPSNPVPPAQPSMPEVAPAATTAPPPTMKPEASPSPSPVMPKQTKKPEPEPQASAPEPAKPVAKHVERRPAVTVKPKHKARPKPKPEPSARPKRAPKAASAQDRITLTGTVRLQGAGGQTVTAEDYRQTVVYFLPDRRRARPRPGTFTIYTHHRDFNPEWLVVPVGSTVTFTNLDTVKHNVFSVSPGNQFNLGYQSAQSSVEHRFDQAGLVLLSCNVHRAMRGDILVVPSRYASTVQSNGSFDLPGVPNVAGTLYMWNPRSRNASMRVKPPFANLRTTLSLNRPAVTVKIGIGS